MNIPQLNNITNNINSAIDVTTTSLNQISNNIQGLHDIIESQTSLLINETFWDKYDALISGIIGVAIGGFITYIVQKKITNEITAGRFAVQRKNLIFAKIYTEIKELQESILEQNKKSLFIRIITTNNKEIERDTWYDDIRQRPTGKFLIWNDFKMDVRKTYVNPTLAEKLENLETLIENYLVTRKNVAISFSNIYDKSEFKINLHKKMINFSDRNSGTVDSSTFHDLIFSTTPADSIKNELTKWKQISESKENINIIKKEYIDELYKLISAEEIFSKIRIDVQKIINEIDSLENYLSSIISKIHEKYEFGKSIEKL